MVILYVLCCLTCVQLWDVHCLDFHISKHVLESTHANCYLCIVVFSHLKLPHCCNYFDFFVVCWFFWRAVTCGLCVICGPLANRRNKIILIDFSYSFYLVLQNKKIPSIFQDMTLQSGECAILIESITFKFSVLHFPTPPRISEICYRLETWDSRWLVKFI